MTKKQEAKLKKLKAQNEYLKKKDKLLSERDLYKKKKSFSYSKALLAYLMFICTAIIIYVGAIIVYLQDTSVLPILITSVVGAIISFITYEVKSVKENSVGGIVYDLAMNTNTTQNSFENTAITNNECMVFTPSPEENNINNERGIIINPNLEQEVYEENNAFYAK